MIIWKHTRHQWFKWTRCVFSMCFLPMYRFVHFELFHEDCHIFGHVHVQGDFNEPLLFQKVMMLSVKRIILNQIHGILTFSNLFCILRLLWLSLSVTLCSNLAKKKTTLIQMAMRNKENYAFYRFHHFLGIATFEEKLTTSSRYNKKRILEYSVLICIQIRCFFPTNVEVKTNCDGYIYVGHTSMRTWVQLPKSKQKVIPTS